MPVPPNWFGVAAFALLGAFVNPGFWLIGAGIEGLYLWALVSQRAFSRDRRRRERQDELALALSVAGRSSRSRGAQPADAIEQQAREIVDLLSRTDATETQMSDVRQMAWLHLKLLAARASILQVIGSAHREHRNLEEQERRSHRPAQPRAMRTMSSSAAWSSSSK